MGTDLVEFEIKLKPGTQPVKQKVRPLNPHQKASLEKQMETWRREGVIEEMVSPWASPLVPAKKPGYFVLSLQIESPGRREILQNGDARSY